MIKEIYIDNFRCFSNFRINPGKFQLWLGKNGSGKTSVLEALKITSPIEYEMKGKQVVIWENLNRINKFRKNK